MVNSRHITIKKLPSLNTGSYNRYAVFNFDYNLNYLNFKLFISKSFGKFSFNGFTNGK